MTNEEAELLQKALGHSYEVFQQFGMWLVRPRGTYGISYAVKAEDMFRRVMSHPDAPSASRMFRVTESESRPFWNDALADIEGLENL